jgi:hypothetical protein
MSFKSKVLHEKSIKLYLAAEWLSNASKCELQTVSAKRNFDYIPVSPAEKHEVWVAETLMKRQFCTITCVREMSKRNKNELYQLIREDERREYACVNYINQIIFAFHLLIT